MKNLLCLVIAAALLAGCATPMPTPEQLASADCGPKPEAAIFQQAIKIWMQATLKDPDSALYRLFSDPVKGCVRDAPISGGKLHFGWLVYADVNAKNGFGGYVGYQSYYFFFRDGKIVGVKQPPDYLWVLF